MPLLPGTCYIEFVRIVVVAVEGARLYSLNDVNFHAIMFLDDDEQMSGLPTVRLQLDQSTGGFKVSSRREDSAWTNHADMRLELRTESTAPRRFDAPAAQSLCTEHVNGEAFYSATGNDYRGEFRGLTAAWAGNDLCLGCIE